MRQPHPSGDDETLYNVMKIIKSQVYMMSSSYSIEMQYGPCSSRPFLHVMEVNLTLVSYILIFYWYILMYVVPHMAMVNGSEFSITHYQ